MICAIGRVNLRSPVRSAQGGSAKHDAMLVGLLLVARLFEILLAPSEPAQDFTFQLQMA